MSQQMSTITEPSQELETFFDAYMKALSESSQELEKFFDAYMKALSVALTGKRLFSKEREYSINARQA